MISDTDKIVSISNTCHCCTRKKRILTYLTTGSHLLSIPLLPSVSSFLTSRLRFMINDYVRVMNFLLFSHGLFAINCHKGRVNTMNLSQWNEIVSMNQRSAKWIRYEWWDHFHVKWRCHSECKFDPTKFYSIFTGYNRSDIWPTKMHRILFKTI